MSISSFLLKKRKPRFLHPPRLIADRLRKLSNRLIGANAVPIGTNRFQNHSSSSSPPGQPPAAPTRQTIFKRIAFPRSNSANRAHTAVCSRCLATGHWCAECRWPIQCRACRRPGHVADNCNHSKDTQRRQDPSISKGKAAMACNLSGSGPRANAQPSAMGQLTIDSGAALAGSSWAAKEPVPITAEAQEGRPNTGRRDLDENVSTRLLDLNPAEWKLSGSSSSPPLPHSTATVNRGENPHCELPSAPHPHSPSQSASIIMAFQRVDPAPFILEGMQHQDVPNRELFVRAVAPATPTARNENLAIVTIDPLRGNPLYFGAVRSVLSDFLRLEKRVPFLDIQSSCLGQALVRLTRTYHRDLLVNESPHIYDNVSVTFHKHSQGRNWHRSEFNEECWLLLLGFPNDYWSERYIHVAIGNFARILLCEADECYLTRLLVRAKVKDVSKVPQFVVFEDPDVANGESWTIQVEVLLQHP